MDIEMSSIAVALALRELIRPADGIAKFVRPMATARPVSSSGMRCLVHTTTDGSWCDVRQYGSPTGYFLRSSRKHDAQYRSPFTRGTKAPRLMRPALPRM